MVVLAFLSGVLVGAMASWKIASCKERLFWMQVLYLFYKEGALDLESLKRIQERLRAEAKIQAPKP